MRRAVDLLCSQSVGCSLEGKLLFCAEKRSHQSDNLVFVLVPVDGCEVSDNSEYSPSSTRSTAFPLLLNGRKE